MTDADRPVPGQAEIPFHIGIKSEHFPRVIEGKIEWIAKTITDQGKISAGRVDARDPATVNIHVIVMSVRIFYQRQQIVDLPDGRGFIDIHLWHLREISRDDV